MPKRTPRARLHLGAAPVPSGLLRYAREEQAAAAAQLAPEGLSLVAAPDPLATELPAAREAWETAHLEVQCALAELRAGRPVNLLPLRLAVNGERHHLLGREAAEQLLFLAGHNHLTRNSSAASRRSGNSRRKRIAPVSSCGPLERPDLEHVDEEHHARAA